MKQRGRQSSLKLATVTPIDERKVPCPDYFSDDERALWDKIIRSTGVQWFPPETHTLLEQFVVLSIAARRPDIEVKDRIRIATTLTRLASNMRISQYTAHGKTKKNRTEKEFWKA